ncbi:alkaline shock response membrane anchor protein AmaP [Streptomyces sp. PT12]|uniref:alkaline shock response membrane anchor protein AmaP n=1 Tax=Streptomyces sp. PT12 TaxID=1510197 RepID=UPI000DE23C6E|nr:alkaline shock response membrane anchor protein AmaP [Streptomyces sp. PT12]RBM17027.1 alkaline shock response membrane anchor protein AmaP [Streptomyces sp. PT12]
MLRTVNRVLMGLSGLLLIGVGLVALAAALDLPRRWGLWLPSGFSWRAPHDVLLTHTDRTQFTRHGWWWPVVIGGLATLLLLSLWWLLAQVRRPRLAEIQIDSGDGARAVLRGRAVEDVLAAEAETFPGVDRARVSLTGRRTAPRVRVGLLLTPQAHPADVVRRLHEEAVDHARTSAGLPALPTETHLRPSRHTVDRVS